MEKQSKISIFEKEISKYKKKDHIIDCLQLASETFGYIPEQVIDSIRKQLNVPKSEIYGVATFYSQFIFTPKAKYNISVCLGTACFVLGGESLIKALKEKLKIEIGETTPDGKFKLQQVRCLGCCSMAPVISINEEIYSHVTVNDLDKILSECK